jgi:tetratricopeptide (TPR) repeat protein
MSPSTSSAITSRLLSALPESVWAEANRRLRLVPELRDLARDDAILDAFCALGGDPSAWRPGALALAAYAARHPKCEGNADAYLSGAGHERVNDAYARLTDPPILPSSNPPASLHPLDDCLPAALALRLRGRATANWTAIAADAVALPDRWRLPLQYLWGLIESPAELFTALLRVNPDGARLAGRCLVVNCTPPEAVELVGRLDPSIPAAHWLAFIQSIHEIGETALAQSLAKSISPLPTPPHPQTLSPDFGLPTSDFRPPTSDFGLHSALLLAATGDFAIAHPALVQAWEQTRKAGALLSERIGQLALNAKDAATALAAFQDALPVEPDNTELRAGLAQTLLMLNQPEAALATIGETATEAPACLLAAARAHLALDHQSEAAETLSRIHPAECSPTLLAEAAHLQFQLGDQPAAIRWITESAATARTDAEKYLTAAQWLSGAGQWEDARAMAVEAAALAPHSAEARERLGLTLLGCGDSRSAIPHFQSAVVFDPARASAHLGLARAALAAGQPALAHEAAERALASAPEPSVEGEAHVLIGQALSAQGKDDQAFEHFHRASTLVPRAPEPWRAMAKHHRERGEADRALATLEAGRQALALVASPHAAPLLADLAQLYAAAGRATEAITALREACAVNPHSPQEHRLLGALLRKQGRSAEAIDVLRRSLQLSPGNAEALHELGLALENLGKPDEAWAAFQQAVLARPQKSAPYFALGRMTLAQWRKQVASASPLQAVAALREAVRLGPEDAEAHALLAEAHRVAGQPEGALESYQAALHLAPIRTEWSLGLGQVCLALGRPEAAIAALQEALKHAPDAQAAAVHHALARAYAQSHLWPEAFQSVQAALQSDPENPALFQLQAEAYARLGLPDEALKAWQAAVALNPRDALMQIGYARCLLDMGRADEARTVYAQAMSLAPDSPEVHLAAGRALLELGEVEQAHQVLAQAVSLAPHSVEAHAALGEAALRAQNCEAAHAAFVRAAELDPDSVARAAHLREAGEALWKMSRAAAAVVVWQRAASLNPKDNRTLARLGVALARLGQFKEALAALDNAVEHNPRETEAAREAARCAIALGEHGKAARYLEHVINLAPGDAEARYLLGQLHEQQNDGEKALALYRQAARLAPGEGRYLAASAETLARLGQLEEALHFVEAAQAASPDNADVLGQAGELYLKAGRNGAAAHVFERVVAARPRDPSAHLSLAKALTLLAEEHEHETRAGLNPESSASSPSAQSVPSVDAVLQQAAALGADPHEVRYWLGRAKAAIGDPKEAQRLLESIASAASAKSIPSMDDLYRALGAALRKSGQLERAREALHAALEHQKNLPPAASAHLELGLTHAALGDRRGAVAAFKRAVAADPNWPIAHYHLAEGLMALGDGAEAAQVLQRAIALKPSAAAWHHRLAKIYQAGHEPKALAHFQRAAELEPGSADYAADLGRVLAKDGDLAAAAEHFRRATEARPANSALWAERGQVHLALGDLNAAQACFKRSAQLDPSSIAAHLGGARVSLALGDLHDATNRAEAAARLAPGEAEVLICLADVQAALGHLQDAENSYAAAASKSKDPAPALLALGRLYFSQGKLDKAIDVLERAASGPSHGEDLREADAIFAALGDVHSAAGAHTSALAAYREAVRIAPRNPKHLLRLGQACRAQGQLDQALAHLAQARDLAPGDDEVLRETGLVFEHRKQYDHALEMYQRAIRAAPQSSINYTRAGAVLKQMKDYAGAVAALERAVALDAKNLEATKQLAVVSALNLMHGEARARA